MIILLTVKKNYTYEVEVQAQYQEGKMQFTSRLISGFISHFDIHATFHGKTIEECLKKIAIALESAIEQAF